jgi:hypothetical protein
MKMVYSNFEQYRLRSYFNRKMVKFIMVLHIKNTRLKTSITSISTQKFNIRIITSIHKTKT